MVQGEVNTLTIPVADPQVAPFACRLGTRDEATVGVFSRYFTPSAGTHTLSISPNCVIAWNTESTHIGQLYAVHISIEATNDATRVELDFLIAIVVGTPPSCGVNGSPTNEILVGQSFTITMTGTHPGGSNLTINHLGLPPEAILTPSAGTNSVSPFTGTFSWTPVASNGGTAHAVTITFTDPGGLQATCGFSVSVIDPTKPTIALSGAASVDEGSPYILTLGAVTGPGGDPVQGDGDLIMKLPIEVSVDERPIRLIVPRRPLN